MIGAREAESATIGIIHPDISDFSFGWLRLEVTPGKFIASANIRHARETVQLVSGVFKILEHTPVEKMGLNRLFDYRIPNEQRWHNLGHRLAPKEDWEGYVEKAGMLSLTIQGTRKDSPSKSIQIKIAPSGLCHPGVFFEVNETFEAPETGGLMQLLHWLGEQWEPLEKYSEDVVEHIVALDR